MNAETRIEPVVNVHRKLSIARQRFHNLALKKTGKNTFAGYNYFELGDFLIPALTVFDEVGLSAVVTFGADVAAMQITDMDNPSDTIVITSPMGSAALKGCHEVQNIGAVETYQRRYLWVAALEIVEHDALDATNGKHAPDTRANPSTGERTPAKKDRDAPFPPGPAKNKTALKDLGRDLWADVLSCESAASLDKLLSSEAALVTQLKEALPQWWGGGMRDGEPYEGLGQVIKRLERDFAGVAETGMDFRGNPILAG